MTLLHNLRNIYCKRLMKNKKIELASPNYCTGCSATDLDIKAQTLEEIFMHFYGGTTDDQ